MGGCLLQVGRERAGGAAQGHAEGCRGRSPDQHSRDSCKGESGGYLRLATNTWKPEQNSQMPQCQKEPFRWRGGRRHSQGQARFVSQQERQRGQFVDVSEVLSNSTIYQAYTVTSTILLLLNTYHVSITSIIIHFMIRFHCIYEVLVTTACLFPCVCTFHYARLRVLITPNLPTNVTPTNIARLSLSRKSPMDMRIPPL